MTIGIYERCKICFKYVQSLLTFFAYVVLAYCAIEITKTPGHNPIFLSFLDDTLSTILNVVLFLLAIRIYTKLPTIIVNRLKTNPKKYFLDFLDSRGWKLGFYRFIIISSKMWSIVLIYYIICSILFLLFVLLLHTLDIIGLDLNIILIKIIAPNYDGISFEPLLGFLLISVLVGTIIFFIIVICGFGFFRLVFSKNKVLNILDTSDIPISFIHKSIDELNLFEFGVEWEKRQSNKRRISNLINNALEFIHTEDDAWAVPHLLRYYKMIIGGINNKSSRMDLLYCVNGLSIKLNAIIINLNCMDNIEDREQIILDLKNT